MTGARFKLAQAAVHGDVPMAVAARSRVRDELRREIMARPADLIYGGTTGALAAVADAEGGADAMRSTRTSIPASTPAPAATKRLRQVGATSLRRPDSSPPAAR
jgi:hypothetical protein